jgi:hypothetical protein
LIHNGEEPISTAAGSVLDGKYHVSYYRVHTCFFSNKHHSKVKGCLVTVHNYGMSLSAAGGGGARIRSKITPLSVKRPLFSFSVLKTLNRLFSIVSKL